MEPLRERFLFGKEGENDFKFIGVRVKQEKDAITTDQEQYAEHLEVPDWNSYKDFGTLDSLLDEEGQAEFRTIVGKIGWVANTSRPDLSFGKHSM